MRKYKMSRSYQDKTNHRSLVRCMPHTSPALLIHGHSIKYGTCNSKTPWIHDHPSNILINRHLVTLATYFPLPLRPDLFPLGASLLENLIPPASLDVLPISLRRDHHLNLSHIDYRGTGFTTCP